MKTIYILLTKSDTILSKLVHLVTSDAYTHVSVSFDERLQTLYSSSRKNGQTLFPAGPCTERLHAGYYHRHAQIPCRLYELPVSDEAYEQAKEEVFCSQFVSEILSRSRAMEIPKDATLMKPGDYTKMPELNCLYRGQVGELARMQKCLRNTFFKPMKFPGKLQPVQIMVPVNLRKNLKELTI